MKLGRRILKVVEIRVRDLVFRRGEGPKNYKGSIRRINMKEIIRIYLREVSDIGSKNI